MRMVRVLAAACGVTACVMAVVACGDDDATTGTPDSGTPDANTGADTSTSPETSTDAGPDAAPAKRVVYVESNNIAPNTNSVLAYQQQADGTLTPLAGSPFLTGGTGVSNPMQVLGPDDGDQQILLSPDNKRLYAVNAGSDTIAVFDVKDDGTLSAITGSPFPSGGINPISVGIAGDQLFVVNQAQDPLRPGVGAPGYVGLPISATGALGQAGTPVTAGTSPQLALVTPDAKLLFGLDFMAPVSMSPAPNAGLGPIRSFAIGANGALTEAVGSPMALPAGDGPPPALGLALHPTEKILYVGFVARKQIGVYTYDPTGALTYVTNTAVTGGAPCWVRFNSAGNRAYVTDTGSNAVSVLDTTTPLAPTEFQYVVLNDKGPDYDGGTMASPSSESYEENLSPDGKYLFVLSQNTNPDLTQTSSNVLHVLGVAADGKVTETSDVKLNLPVGVRPQGVAILH